MFIDGEKMSSYILLSTANKVKGQAGSVFTVNLGKKHKCAEKPKKEC